MLSDHLFNDVTSRIIKCAIEVHRHLGPGLLESAYCACLLHELASDGLTVRRRLKVPLRYKGVKIDCSYELDLLVNDTVIVELKTVDRLVWIHKAQLLTYLRLTGHPAGLLINFNVPVLKDGVRRLLNTGKPQTTEVAGQEQHGDTETPETHGEGG